MQLKLLLSIILKRHYGLLIYIWNFLFKLDLRDNCCAHINRNIQSTHIWACYILLHNRVKFRKYFRHLILMECRVLRWDLIGFLLLIDTNLMNKCILALSGTCDLVDQVLIQLWPMDR